MNTTDYLEKQYNHSFEMVKFGESKNIALIAFNGAIIVGISKLLEGNFSCYLEYYFYFAIAMCSISIFISFSALIAKIKHKANDISINKNDNLLFYATFANMTPSELINKINENYQCESKNANYENDIAKQVIITSQIAYRKFKLYNLAIGFTFSGILTPLSLIIYKLFFDHDK